MVGVVLTHHANQYLIGNGYADRDGISTIVEGYSCVLDTHERYGVPLSLHLSGTLIESLAWSHPEFLERIYALWKAGRLALLGGTYSENVMPAFDPAFNRRQLDEFLVLMRLHFPDAVGATGVCWIPERVWSTSDLAAVIADPGLANGGYHTIMLDDRARCPPTAGGAAPGLLDRRVFDALGPYGGLDGLARNEKVALWRRLVPALRPYRIRGTGIRVLPISCHLRYWIPPRSSSDFEDLAAFFRLMAEEDDSRRVLFYADDLEQCAGVGGWDRAGREQYRDFIGWLVAQDHVEPVDLPTALRRAATDDEVDLGSAAYFELAETWRAGEDYRGWLDSAAWAPHRRLLEGSIRAVEDAQRAGGEPGLLALAWKHVLASSYETAWFDLQRSRTAYRPAPWVKALASHSRSARVMARAALWFRKTRDADGASVTLDDVDDDGERELVFRTPCLFLVVSPAHGGRIVHVFSRSGATCVSNLGNPTDDWNLHEGLNSYMETPANHIGGVIEVGNEDAAYRVVKTWKEAGAVRAELASGAATGPFRGASKVFTVSTEHRSFHIDYVVPGRPRSRELRLGLSPDYLRLLRRGRRAVTLAGDARSCSVAVGEIVDRVELVGDGSIRWAGTPDVCLHSHMACLSIVSRGDRWRLTWTGSDRSPERAPAREERLVAAEVAHG